MGADVPPTGSNEAVEDLHEQTGDSSPSSAGGSSVDSMSPTPPTPRPEAQRPAPAPAASSWCSDWFSLLKDCCNEDHRSIETELQPPMPAGSGARIESWGPFFYDDEEVEECCRRAEGRRVELGSVTANRIVRYRVCNEIVQNQRRSGVAYRYTKSEMDKVRREDPVPWGSVVQGVDEGDGWIRVGRYFLPTAYQGLPLLMPVNDDQAMPKAPLAMPKPPTASRAIVYDSRSGDSRGQPCIVERECGSRALGSLPVDRRPPTPSSGQARAVPKAPPAVRVAEVEAEPACEDRQWRHLPSVGTWLRQVQAPSELAEEEDEEAAADEGESFEYVAVSSEEEDLEMTVAAGQKLTKLIEELDEPQLFADVLGKKPHALAMGDDCDDVSPSTCPPDTPYCESFATPTSLAVVSPTMAN